MRKHSTYSGVVHRWMCDHYGHMNVRWYAHVFDDAGFVLWPSIGITTQDFVAAKTHTVVAKTETDFRAELLAGQIIAVRSHFVRVGNKSVEYQQQLVDLETDEEHATQRVVEVFFDPDTRTSVAIPPTIRARLEASLRG